jgi:hypothetical protein
MTIRLAGVPHCSPVRFPLLGSESHSALVQSSSESVRSAGLIACSSSSEAELDSYQPRIIGSDSLTKGSDELIETISEWRRTNPPRAAPYPNSGRPWPLTGPDLISSSSDSEDT